MKIVVKKVIIHQHPNEATGCNCNLSGKTLATEMQGLMENNPLVKESIDQRVHEVLKKAVNKALKAASIQT